VIETSRLDAASFVEAGARATGDLERIRIWHEAITTVRRRLVSGEHQPHLRPRSLAAPEQTSLLAASAGPPATVYNLGALGVLITGGSLPWADLPLAEQEAAILRDEPELPACEELPVEVRRRLHRVLRMATAKDAAQRHADVADLELDVGLLQLTTSAGDGLIAHGLVGRTEALDELEQVIGRARQHRFERVLVTGDSGMGKTQLWRSVTESTRSPHRAVGGRTRPWGRSLMPLPRSGM
jgi:hypothetical protein